MSAEKATKNSCGDLEEKDNKLSLLSFFSSSDGSSSKKAAPVSGKITGAQDIPKEELMALCMKLNKRMQQADAKNQELVQRKVSLLEERRKLLDLVTSTTSLAMVVQDEQDVDIESLRASLLQWRHLQYHQKALVAEGSTSDSSPIVDSKMLKLQQDLEAALSSNRYSKNQIELLENDLRDKSARIEVLQKEAEDATAKRDEAILYATLQLDGQKSKGQQRDKDLEDAIRNIEDAHGQLSDLKSQLEDSLQTIKSNEEVIALLQSRLCELEPELERYRERVKEHDRNVAAGSVMKAELEALVRSLKKDLKSALEARDDSSKRTRELEEYRMKAEGQLMKVAAMTEQVESLKIEVEEKNALINQLRSEMQTSEQAHAIRTAALATCEAQLTAVRAEVKVKNDLAQEYGETVKTLQSRLALVEDKLRSKAEDMAAMSEEADRRAREADESNAALVRALRTRHEAAMDALRKDFAKKSSAARILVSEKEEEVRVLQARVSELVSEIATGAPVERKIFEIAQKQALRDAVHGIFNDTRELAFQQLQSAIALKDLQLAETQQSQASLTAEVAELRRTSRREGVNMDYLKNVVLQYMSFPAQSPERQSLVPVIAMLLQFSPREKQVVDRALRDPGLGLGSVWSVPRPAKEVKKRSLRLAASIAAASSSSSSSSGVGADGLVAEPKSGQLLAAVNDKDTPHQASGGNYNSEAPIAIPLQSSITIGTPTTAAAKNSGNAHGPRTTEESEPDEYAYI